MLSSVLIMNNSSTINIFYGTVSRNSSRISVRSTKSGLFKKNIKKLSNTPTSSDRIMIADGAVEVDVDIVDKLNIFIHLYGFI